MPAAVGSKSEFGSFVADFEHELVLLNSWTSLSWPKRTRLERRQLQKLRQQAADDVVDRLRIGLAFGGFHYLTDKKFEDAFVAGFEFSDVVGIFFDDFAGGLFDGVVRDLRSESFGSDDFGGRAAGFKHGGEYFFCDGGSDFAGF